MLAQIVMPKRLLSKLKFKKSVQIFVGIVLQL